MFLCAYYKRHSFLEGIMETNGEVFGMRGPHFQIILTPTNALSKAPVPPEVPIPHLHVRMWRFFSLKYKSCINCTCKTAMAKKYLPTSSIKETGVHPVQPSERPSGAVPAIPNWPVEVQKRTGAHDLQYQGRTKHQGKKHRRMT